ncbi:MAG: D-isomer specific 2-hydroxyacid dehydrogenase NAD-binding protein [Actinomycetia bacterium]|nr:D-isomer specific 2-hydroxyacid dehydrogenase NAD-binding protein [Actinomycetes bacterium]
MLIWVPTAEVAAGLAGLPGADVEVVAPDGAPLPPSADRVEFYVPPFSPRPPGIAAMRQMPRLAVVQTLTAGVDRLLADLPAGVTLCNARGAHDASTAEWVVAAMLAALREFPLFAREQAAQRWTYHFTDCLAGKTVLIVGYGSIGAAVERRLAGFEVQVVRVARTARPDVAAISDLPGLLPGADVVVLLAPVTPETIGMADAAFLARMKDGALLVNAARGSLLDTGALVAELRRGRLRAALDVTEPEPLPAGHPLWTMPGVFITPHEAASTPVSVTRMISHVRGQAERFLNGAPLLNVISGSY